MRSAAAPAKLKVSPSSSIELLTPADRLHLMEQLWNSLSDEDVSLSKAQEQELDRRLDEAFDVRAGGVVGAKAMTLPADCANHAIAIPVSRPIEIVASSGVVAWDISHSPTA